MNGINPEPMTNENFFAQGKKVLINLANQVDHLSTRVSALVKSGDNAGTRVANMEKRLQYQANQIEILKQRLQAISPVDET